MRIANSRADKRAFIVFVVLAALLAVLLATNVGSNSEDLSREVSSFANLSEDSGEGATSSEPAATAVPTTEPIALPTPEPTATPLPTPIPTAVPTPEPEAEAASANADTDAGDDSASAQTQAAAPATNTGSASAAATADTQTDAGADAGPSGDAPASESDPGPSGEAPASESDPGPSGDAPGSTTTTSNVSAPPPAPVGGTFTHTLTAKVAQPTLHTSAGGPTFMPSFNGTALPPVNPTVFGNPLVYRVLAGEPGDAWAQVYVPARPNGTRAWVQTSQFNWGSSNRKIVINVSNNTVTVYEGSNVLLTTDAVTGKSSSPTPLANGWVEETMAGPSAAYGPTLISLGIFSDALNSFGGSIPKIALHGTSSPGLMGQYASNGCIRVRNEIITQIAGMVTPGSRVEIVS